MKMKARFKSFKHAFNGIRILILSEVNARIHLVMTCLVLILGIMLQLSSTEWILLSLTISLVFFSEVINTVVERMSDMISREHNPHIGQIKDLSAAAVLITSLIALAVGGFLFVPKLISLFP